MEIRLIIAGRGVSSSIALVILGLVLAVSACSSEDQEVVEGTDDAVVEAEEEPATEESADMAKHREAFGLPLPPELTSIERQTDEVRVITTMSLDELAEFYESRLQDYEVLRPPQKLRVLGLREYMPEVYGRRYAGTVRLFYMRGRPGPARAKADVTADEEQDEASTRKQGAQAYQRTKPLHKRQKGEPVTDRTAEGELLAPGARWGEPYTPPPGSPLHKERFRSNWGKPYGTWVAQ